MTSDSSIYWVYLETDTSHPELYLPPDTPIERVNPKRLHTILKKRHARQWQRLKTQQTEELVEYQKEFSIQYQNDLFVKPNITACEIISGTDFLNDHSDDISQFLSNIPDIIAEKNQVQDYHSKKDNSNQRRQDYLAILAKKYRSGFEKLEESHQSQVYDLGYIQRHELKVIPREIIDPVRERPHKSTSNSTSPPTSSKYDADSKKRRREEELEERSKRDKKEYKSKNEKTASSSSKTAQVKTDYTLIESSVNKHIPKKSTDTRLQDSVVSFGQKSPSIKFGQKPPSIVSSGQKPPSITSTGQKPPSIAFGQKPPSIVSSGQKTPSIASTGQKPPPISSSGKKSASIASGQKSPSAVSSGRKPPSITSSKKKSLSVASSNTRHPVAPSNESRIPIVTNSGALPPTVGSSSPIPSGSNQRSSDTLLLNKNLGNYNLDTLMSRGSLVVQNKPNRVIIRSRNGTTTTYGNPKDYDDAINSSQTRADNPVYKRRMKGKDYLFYKTESGHVIAIGLVSEIQPLIHKFFLSM